MTITNNDLHIMLTEIKGDVKALIEKANNSLEWQEKHEAKDDERFGSLNRYAASVAIVAAGVGACGTWVWNKIVGA